MVSVAEALASEVLANSLPVTIVETVPSMCAVFTDCCTVSRQFRVANV